MPLVSSGVEHGNLRELALARMRDLGTQVSELCYLSKLLCATCTLKDRYHIHKRMGANTVGLVIIILFVQ